VIVISRVDRENSVAAQLKVGTAEVLDRLGALGEVWP
jgi:hypothetical protein